MLRINEILSIKVRYQLIRISGTPGSVPGVGTQLGLSVMNFSYYSDLKDSYGLTQIVEADDSL